MIPLARRRVKLSDMSHANVLECAFSKVLVTIALTFRVCFWARHVAGFISLLFGCEPKHMGCCSCYYYMYEKSV